MFLNTRLKLPGLLNHILYAISLLFLLFYNPKFKNSKFIIPLVIVFSFMSLSLTIDTLYKRYYVTPKSGSVAIEYNAEKTTNDNHFKTN